MDQTSLTVRRPTTSECGLMVDFLSESTSSLSDLSGMLGKVMSAKYEY